MDTHTDKNVPPFINGTGPVNDSGYVNGSGRSSDSYKAMAQRLYTDVSHLFQKEGQLIRTELSEKSSQVKEGVISLVTAGVVMFVGLICVAATSMILLALVTELWLAAVIVTVAFLLIGAILLGAAKKKMEPEHLKPNKSIHAFEEIRHSLKEKVHEITKH